MEHKRGDDKNEGEGRDAMIKDYSVYRLSGREKMLFYGVGYACISTAAYLFYHSVAVSLVLGLSAGIFKGYVEKRMAEKRMEKLEAQFRDMLYSLSASVAAGRQMDEALIEAEENLSVIYGAGEPIMRELRYMRINIVENKESDKPLLTDFAFRSKSEDINNFVQVYILACRNTGGDLEKVIEHTSEIITDKMNIEREIRVITAQKKAEGRIIAAMPPALLLMMNLFSYSYIAPLYETVTGNIIMTGALAAMIYGIILMEKLSDIDI